MSLLILDIRREAQITGSAYLSPSPFWLSSAKSRSISAENPNGAGGMATDSISAFAA